MPDKLHSTPDAISCSPVGAREHMELSSMYSTTPYVPDIGWKISKALLAGLRAKPSPEEYDDALEMEQSVLGS